MLPPPRPQIQPVLVQTAEAVEAAREPGGITVAGIRFPLPAVAGVVLTLGGLGIELASHFVKQPEIPTGSNPKVEDLISYQKDKAKADKTVHWMESAGRAMSDIGQIVGMRRSG